MDTRYEHKCFSTGVILMITINTVTVINCGRFLWRIYMQTNTSSLNRSSARSIKHIIYTCESSVVSVHK